MDIFETLEQLKQERFGILIFLSSPDKCGVLTDFCMKASELSGAKYIDLLEMFFNLNDYNQNIEKFGPEKLRKLIIRESKDHQFMIVDHVDFLIDTWRRSERKNFYRFLDDQWDSYKEGMKAKIIICLQETSELEGLSITDSNGQSRIFHLSDFNEVP